MPEETAKVLRDGVLQTGDLGRLDEQGRLHLLGRKNDVLVLSNGEKLYLPEAEAILSESLGDEIALVIMYDTLTLVAGKDRPESEVKKAVDAFNEKQPIGKRIMNIRIIPGALPRTATGKLKRWKVEECL